MKISVTFFFQLKSLFSLQRISLARALYAVLDDQKTEKAAFVILLDDPLSAVDPSVSTIFGIFIFITRSEGV